MKPILLMTHRPPQSYSELLRGTKSWARNVRPDRGPVDMSGAQTKKASALGRKPSIAKMNHYYFLVAFPSINVIQFVPSIDISNFKL